MGGDAETIDHLSSPNHQNHDVGDHDVGNHIGDHDVGDDRDGDGEII